MSAIDFPNSPSNGQVFTVGNRTWVHQSGIWSLLVKPVLTTAATEPTNPAQGDLWFDTVSGSTFFFYDSEWIEVGQPIVDDVLQRMEAKGDLLVAAAADSVARVPVGSNGQVLIADSVETAGVKWSTMDLTAYVDKAIVDAKGDLLVGSAADTVVRLGVGTNGQALVADSVATAGVKWGNVTSSGDDDQIVIATRMFT